MREKRRLPAAPDDIVPLAFDAVASLKREMVIAWHPSVLRTRPEVAKVIEEIAGTRKRKQD